MKQKNKLFLRKARVIFLVMSFFLFFSFLRAEAAEWVMVGESFATGGSHPDIVLDPAMAFNPSTSEPYVAYADRDYEGRLSVKKFNGTSWVDVGARGFSENYIDEDAIVSISFNPVTDEPYVSYLNYNAGQLISRMAAVKKFNGLSWVSVGDPVELNNGGDVGSVIPLVFNPATNEPYVAYGDGAYDYKMTVKRFNGTNWLLVGNPGFSSRCYAPSMAFNPMTSQPYVVFQDMSDSYKVAVERFNGLNWEIVGNGNIGVGNSDMDTNRQSIAFDRLTGIPYIKFADYYEIGGDEVIGGSSVKKFNGLSWIDVGVLGSNMSLTSLVFNPSTNEPYLSGITGISNYKEKVIKFNGSQWEGVGSDFGIRSAYGSSLVFNPATSEPYVAFHDLGAGNDTGGVVVMKYSLESTAPFAPGGLSVR